MTALMQSKLAMAGMLMAVLAARLTAQTVNPQEAVNRAAEKGQAAASKREIVVSLEDRKLALLEDGKVVKAYKVAVGKPSTPSPEGAFIIERRVANPTYSHDGLTVPPGPNNPVGTRWMGLNLPGYGIHGTNAPSSIGKAASHGCVRMGKNDVEDLFSRVNEGDTVTLIGKRNEETAQLFGDGSNPTQGTQAASLTAMASAAPAAAVPQPQRPANSSTVSAFLTRTVLSAVAGMTALGSM